MPFVILCCTEQLLWNRETSLAGYQLTGKCHLWLLSINQGLVYQTLVRANGVFNSHILWIQRPMVSVTVLMELMIGVEVEHGGRGKAKERTKVILLCDR